MHLPQIQPPAQKHAYKPVKKKGTKKQILPNSSSVLLGTTLASSTLTPAELNAPPSTTEVNGIIFASNTLNTHAGVASVLMQQPGKQKMKEIKARRNKAGGNSGGDGTPEVEGNADGARGRQVKDLVFGQLVKANMEYERSKELKWFVCTGRLPFTEAEKLGIFFCCLVSHTA
jgi:hypothetical protein